MHTTLPPIVRADRTHLFEVGLGQTVGDVKAQVAAAQGERSPQQQQQQQGLADGQSTLEAPCLPLCWCRPRRPLPVCRSRLLEEEWPAAAFAFCGVHLLRPLTGVFSSLPWGGLPATSAAAGISVEDQRVLFNGKQLEDEQLLTEAGVSDDSTLLCLLRLLGGAKKRKKKTYTKPKKQKHKHKKIKLRVLKFYKVRPRAPVCLRTARARVVWGVAAWARVQHGRMDLLEVDVGHSSTVHCLATVVCM